MPTSALPITHDTDGHRVALDDVFTEHHSMLDAARADRSFAACVRT